MIHYVIKEVDEGAPLLVKELLMIEGESIRDLESRVHDLGQYLLLAGICIAHRGLEHEAIVEGTIIAINTLWERRNFTDKP